MILTRTSSGIKANNLNLIKMSLVQFYSEIFKLCVSIVGRLTLCFFLPILILGFISFFTLTGLVSISK